MNYAEFVSDNNSLQSFVEMEKHLTQLIIELEQKIKQSKDYGNTRELRRELAEKTRFKQEVQALRKLAIGNFVQNGTPTPGEVVAVRTQNHRGLVDIRWWGKEEIASYPPALLKILSASDMEYIWDGQRFEKLIRKCDRIECTDIQILSEEIEKQKSDRNKFSCKDKTQLAICDRRINYCKNRIKELSALLAPQEDTKRGISEAQQKLLSRLYGEERQGQQLITLPISQIRRNPLCQQREELDLRVVEEYKEAFLSGIKLPPVKVKYDGSIYWLYDGFHTTASALEAGLTELRVEVTEGQLRDAILASVGVNADHGLRRSNDTKRNAVRTLLQDEEWREWSDREIAKRCKVSNTFVSNLRKEYTTKNDFPITTVNVYSSNPKKYKDQYGNERIMNVENIGKNSTNGHIVLNEVSKDTNSTKTFNDKQEHLPEDAMLPSYGNISAVRAATIKFLPGQLLQLKLSSLTGVPESLKNLNHAYCVVTSPTETGNYNVKFFGKSAIGSSFVVKQEDLKTVDSVSLTLTLSPEKYLSLLTRYKYDDEIESAIYKCLER